MKNLGSIGLLIVVLFLCMMAWQIIGGVTLAMSQETIAGRTGEVWNTTQRAIDLLPRLEREVEVFMEDRQEIVAQITTARNDFLAAQEAGDLAQLNAVHETMLDIRVQIEAYPTINLTDQQRVLMYETAGSINRIAYARGQLIDAQVQFNKNRLLFMPVGLIFPRQEILGENVDPGQPLPPSTFGEG